LQGEDACVLFCGFDDLGEDISDFFPAMYGGEMMKMMAEDSDNTLFEGEGFVILYNFKHSHDESIDQIKFV
jgi:hypothetical protein